MTAGPSDQGLAGERTSLAWARIGLSLLAVPGGILAYAAGRELVVALLAAVFATGTGLALLVVALRRQRAAEGMVARRESVLAADMVVLAATTIVLVDVAGLGLILGRG